MEQKKGNIFIGCSGFSYDHWDENFYPSELSKNKRFEYYTEQFSTVELNVTFYRTPKEQTFHRWYEKSPDNFRFAVKGSRYITHLKRLKDPKEHVQYLFSRINILKEKLAVVLWQFPPRFEYNKERFHRFIDELEKYDVYHAFEFRHKSWMENIEGLLPDKKNYTLVRADWPEYLSDITEGGFAYIRRHGGGSYNVDYDHSFLQNDAEYCKKVQEQGKDVFIYFNNDANGYAPKNAKEVEDMIS
ncbi:MAG: DUF72 domain-containing protein [Spirochaetia bacterium]